MRLEKSSQGARLRAWLQLNGVSQKALAKALKVSGGIVSIWIKGGVPEWHQRAKLERFTGGALQAADWLTAKEAREIKRVRPFKAVHLDAKAG